MLSEARKDVLQRGFGRKLFQSTVDSSVTETPARSIRSHTQPKSIHSQQQHTQPQQHPQPQSIHSQQPKRRLAEPSSLSERRGAGLDADSAVECMLALGCVTLPEIV